MTSVTSSATRTRANAYVSQEPTCSPRDLINRELTVIARKHDLTLAELKSKNRFARHVEARRECYRLLAAAPYYWSTPRIGAFFGRDHSTVVYALSPEESRAVKADRKRRYIDERKRLRALVSQNQ